MLRCRENDIQIDSLSLHMKRWNFLSLADPLLPYAAPRHKTTSSLRLSLPSFLNIKTCEVPPSVDVWLCPPASTFACFSNPLGEEQRHVGPLVALANTLASLPRLKVLDVSNCCLIGLAGHRYHGLNALGSTFAGTKNCLTHLRYNYVSFPHCLSLLCTVVVAVSFSFRDMAIQKLWATFFVRAAERLCSPLLRIL